MIRVSLNTVQNVVAVRYAVAILKARTSALINANGWCNVLYGLLLVIFQARALQL